MYQEAVKLEKDDAMSIHDIFHSYSEQETSSLVDAQKVLFFLIKDNLPHTTLFGPLIELCAELGAPNIAKLSNGKNATYTGHSTVQEFLECQAEDAEIPNGTADSIVKNVKDYLHETDLDQNKMTCFASDGPAVMTGKRNDVVAQLKRDNPALIDVHCVNHRLQLAVSSAFKSVTEIESVDEMLMGLFKYYHYSTVRSKSLEQMQTLIREMGNTADDTDTWEKPGPYLSRVDELGEQYNLEKVGSRRTDVSRSKTLFLDKLMENLEQRLKVTPILTSLSALDLRKALDSSLLTFHGDAEITELAEHFGLDVEKTQLEWSQVKELFAEEVDTSSPSTILKTLTSLKPQLGDLYPNIVKLLSIHATVILSTSEVERAFSHVKLIVTDYRNRLKIDNCTKLLMVSMNAKSSADIDLRKCVAKFQARKKRRL
ncbi:E3 SUMO-protein ligase KIAA1586-like [Haliotis asinina]|uniref:E3 SUMO-protein ligase KIAA1586-like n=1 Tax=Haliotis asinina TaxID=109174 RepID=UPI003531D566